MKTYLINVAALLTAYAVIVMTYPMAMAYMLKAMLP